MLKFMAVVFCGLEIRIYTLTANDREHAHKVLADLPRIRAFYLQTAQQRPLYIHMIQIPENNNVNQVYYSQY